MVVAAACGSGADDKDILERLRALPGVTAVEIEPSYDYPRAFQLSVEQPVDHDDPGGPQFAQRIYLSHADESLPMVFAPSGYGVTPQSGQELCALLGANCLNVAHRFFPGARPTPLDWRYLTIEQAAADHHRIVELFETLYTGPWVSSGASKGGETVLFHRRFYPDDVDATVAYVAPLLMSDSDPRFVPFLASIGTPDDRQRIHDFQRLLLERRATLVPIFDAWFTAVGLSYSGDADADFEAAVQDYEWSFWQYHDYEASEIPDASAADEIVFAYLARAVPLQYSSDTMKDYFLAYIYQAFTELGYPAMEWPHLQDLLRYEPVNIGQATFAGRGVTLTYRPEKIPDVLAWLQSEGERIVLLYGGADPWTAGAIDVAGNPNILEVIQPGADHTVEIADLDERQLVLEQLEAWLGVDIAALVQQSPIHSVPRALRLSDSMPPGDARRTRWRARPRSRRAVAPGAPAALGRP